MNSNGGASFFGSDWLGAFLIIAILFGGGLGWGGGRGPMPMPDVATKEYVMETVNNQGVQNGLRDILLSSANNNYEMAQRINDQTGVLQQQMFAHQLNEESRFGELRSKLDQLGAQMEQCCCSIKTQMLQDKYDEALRELNKAYTDKSNGEQSAYLLSVMGKWVANAPAAAGA